LNFVAMGGATIGVMYYVDIASFPGFLAMFLVLFITTGVGNGSTFRMIPSIFREEKLREAECAGETARGGAESGRHRERCGDRLYLGDWCVRRVRDPTRVQRLDRQAILGARGLPLILRDLRRRYVVVLPAPKPFRPALADEPRRGVGLRQ
jgi:hypothetical protein